MTIAGGLISMAEEDVEFFNSIIIVSLTKSVLKGLSLVEC
jgi:hypothetical protein